MKLPPMLVSASTPQAGYASAPLDIFTLWACTVNLGASPRRPGHPQLKHCFAKITDINGQAVTTYAYGRSGLAHEPYPDLASVRSEPIATLNAEELSKFSAAFRECGEKPYQWGRNDCCSCLQYALEQGTRTEAPGLVRKAARDISNSPEVF